MSKSVIKIFRSAGCVRRWAVFEAVSKLLLLQLLVLLSFPATAGHEVPEKINGAEVISAESLLAEVSDHPELVIVDTRLKGDWDKGYIEGAINMTDTETDCNSLANIIPDYSNPVMFYCNGVLCERSANAVGKALVCGYTKIYWLRGGFNEWKAEGFPYLSN